MTTAVAPDIEILEHLVPEIRCSNDKHGDTIPRADWWYDQHGCADRLFCNACVEKIRARFERCLGSGLFRALECGICRQDFTSIDDLYRVVPL
ncbi:hypothetical protein [Nocardia sp. CC227C]|uniref:hypothetical protein n=1 Tax=Nocardia sp. CC227C TaxID=3044562 RepID=UPI00278C0CE6|nr:hypothetical protein [Nocardia sp. CC227C]